MGKSHYLLYTLVSAIYPRMLMTFDENLKPKHHKIINNNARTS